MLHRPADKCMIEIYTYTLGTGFVPFFYFFFFFFFFVFVFFFSIFVIFVLAFCCLLMQLDSTRICLYSFSDISEVSTVQMVRRSIAFPWPAKTSAERNGNKIIILIRTRFDGGAPKKCSNSYLWIRSYECPCLIHSRIVVDCFTTSTTQQRKAFRALV